MAWASTRPTRAEGGENSSSQLRPNWSKHAGVPLILLLAACSSGTENPATPPRVGETIECAVGGAVEFKPVCTVERSHTKGFLTLIVHHPDGAFRRFDVLDNGRGLALADGIDQAVTSYQDHHAEIAVGMDRYRFPITVRHAKKADAKR